MPKFSKTSKNRLATCHQHIQNVMNEVVRTYDCSIIEGHRSEEKHKEHVKAKRTKVTYANTKHRFNPSKAVDVSPYPIPDDWGKTNAKERAKFYHFAGFVQRTAVGMGYTLRWGGDWDNDKDFDDQTFDDLVHFELK